MKKKTILLTTSLGLGLITGIFNFALASPPPEEQLPGEDEPFWDLMSQLDRPDDADCEAITVDYFENTIGMSHEDAVTESSFACTGIGNMPAQMQTDMAAEGVTTNIFDQADWHHVQNLYFERTGYGKIEFTEEIDFMSRDFMVFMGSFAQKMEMGQGLIGLDADLVEDLRNVGAVLTMYNIPDMDNPVILVDGEVDDGDVVSGITYDRDARTITFNAAHFTEFEAVDESNLTERPKVKTVKARLHTNIDGKKVVRVIAHGDRYNNDTTITLRRREPYKIKHVSNNRIIAYFSLEKLLRSGQDELTVRVETGDKTRKFDKKLILSSLKEYYQEL